MEMKRVVSIIWCLIILLLSLTSCTGDKWPTDGLGAMLPTPNSGTIKITINNEDSFYASINNTNSDDYNNYVKVCDEKGFNIEKETDSYSFESFNSDGFKLRIVNYSKSFGISLEAPIKLETLRWPNNSVGRIVPKPESVTGKNEWEYENSFFVYVGNTTLEQFNEYIDKCSNAGFNVDYNRGKKFYRAYNPDHYYVSMDYEGFGIFSLRAEYKEDDDATVDESSEAPSNAQTVTPTEAPTETLTTVPMQKPTEKNTEKPTIKPTEKTTEKQKEIPTDGQEELPQASEIEVVEYTNRVEAGSIAYVEIIGKPSTEYKISVYYSTRASKAQGLENKTSDYNGNVRWEWKVSPNANPGEVGVKIEGGGAQTRFTFVVY